MAGNREGAMARGCLCADIKSFFGFKPPKKFQSLTRLCFMHIKSQILTSHVQINNCCCNLETGRGWVAGVCWGYLHCAGLFSHQKSIIDFKPPQNFTRSLTH